MREWDLLPVSREEFERRQEDVPHVVAELDTDYYYDDDIICMTHYTSREGEYLGTLKITHDGAEYLVPDGED